MKISLPQVRHDRKGFNLFADLFEKTKDCFLDDVEIDMSETSWFDADMCAVLGALLYGLGDKLNGINLKMCHIKLKRFCQKTVS